MKKIILIFSFILLMNGISYADTLKGEISNSALTVFNEENNFGLKDNDGNIIVQPQYKKLIRLGNSSWIAQKKGKYGLIDNNGDVLINIKYRHADRMLGKYVKLGNERDFAIYNDKGKAVIPPEYSSINMLFGEMFLTCKNYKYGISDKNGKIILDNIFDDIYMPKSNVMRIQYNGEWYEIEQIASGDFTLPEDVKNIKENSDFKVTAFIKDPVAASGYSAVTFTDYLLKVFSSISPAHEETIDELMFSQGADTVSIFMKLSWIPKYPFTYIKKYYHNIRTPNNGPLVDVKNGLKQKMQ